MPEGDSLFQAARKLRDPLVGEVVERLEGSHRAILANGRRMTGTRVTGVESLGKHLLIHFDNDWALRTHLGMTGRWHLYRTGERWRASPGHLRVGRLSVVSPAGRRTRQSDRLRRLHGRRHRLGRARRSGGA